MDVERVQDRRVERVENRRPSEVFLALWRYYALDQRDRASVDDFAVLADVWQQIRELEEIAARERRRENLAKLFGGWFPQRTEPPIPDRVQDPGDPSPVCAPVRDDSAEPVSESDHSPEEADEEAEAEAKKARSLQSAKGFAERKRKALARVEAFRTAGGKLAAIVEASGGKLTMDVLLDLIACKPQPVVTWAALEKALNKLEPAAASAAGGASPSPTGGG